MEHDFNIRKFHQALESLSESGELRARMSFSFRYLNQIINRGGKGLPLKVRSDLFDFFDSMTEESGKNQLSLRKLEPHELDVATQRLWEIYKNLICAKFTEI